MKTNKYIATTSLQHTQLRIPESFETSKLLQVSLVLPPIYLAKQTQIDDQSQVTIPKSKKQQKQIKDQIPVIIEPYVQFCLQVINKEDQLIRHETIQEFDQYLKSNNKIKEVHIHTIQISKTGKSQSGKHNTIINQGKNIGKSSETSIFQQSVQEIIKKYQVHINKKIEVYPHFMLLDLYKYHKGNIGSDQQQQQDSLKFPQFIQRKYDGLRCGAFSNIQITPDLFQQGSIFNNNNITLLSRGHKEFTALDAITLSISNLFNLLMSSAYLHKLNLIFKLSEYVQKHPQQRILPHNLLLDGELYIHNKPLQVLNSIIRNGTQCKDKQDICLVIYDIDITLMNRSLQIQLPFHQRKQLLDIIQVAIQELNILNVVIAPTYTAESIKDLDTLFSSFIQDKYEGAVIRDPNSIYCYALNNKRSKDSLKYKLKLDMEVWICNYLDGQGKDTGSIIYECKIDQNQSDSFQVVQNTTYDNRKKLFELLKQKPQYFEILKQIPLNIEYAALSQVGLPQQPRGIYFRTENINIEIPDELVQLI